MKKQPLSLASEHPTLAREYSLLNEQPAEEITHNSAKKVIWRCSENHYYQASVGSRRRKESCPYCSNKKQCYSNSFQNLNPRLYEIALEKDFLKTVTAKKESGELTLYCSNNHTFIINSPKSATVGFSNNWRKDEPLQAMCKKCLYKEIDTGFNDVATIYPHLLNEWSQLNEEPASKTIAKYNGSYHWQCELGHTWKASLRTRLKGHGCRTCGHRNLTKERLISNHPILSSQWSERNLAISMNDHGVGSHQEFWWQCNKCSHNWKDSPKNRLNYSLDCPICYGRTSGLQTLVVKLVHEILPTTVTLSVNDRSLPGVSELDIYIPELNKAIEVNGCYWHSDEGIVPRNNMTAKEYHQTKIDAARAHSIDIAFIWECDWKNKNKEVQESLQSWLVESTHMDDIFKRLTESKKEHE